MSHCFAARLLTFCVFDFFRIFGFGRRTARLGVSWGAICVLDLVVSARVCF